MRICSRQARPSTRIQTIILVGALGKGSIHELSRRGSSKQNGSRSNLLRRRCTMRGVSQRTKDIIALAGKILAEDHPQTLRQLHYRIFSLGVIDYKNDRASYRKLCRTLTDARRAHRRGELLRKECTPT